MGTVVTLTSLNYVPLLTSVDVVPLMKTAGVVENSRHCIYSIGLKCFLNFLSLYHLVFYIYIYISPYLYVPDEGSLLSKYRDCTTFNEFEFYIYI